MSMKNIIKNFFYLEDEEEHVTHDEVTEKNVKQQQSEVPAINARFKKERKVVPQQLPNVSAPSQNNVVSLHAATTTKGAKVVLVEPRVYAEAQDIAENLKNKRATIVNLQRIERDQGIRIIDFLSGTVYALGGDIQRIGTDIFLCTPENVEVSGEISNYIIDEI
ncbi:cell division protein SepF [Lysinibacillus sp. LZ02]|uniref:cell division protein SepF n=1 Tax=Lysinibacillus sp. LZ02 TaxID=3420668 RepID=UPI003D3668EA